MADFVDLLERTTVHAQAYLDEQPRRHVGARASRDELVAALQGSLPRHGEDAAAVVDLLAAQAGPRGGRIADRRATSASSSAARCRSRSPPMAGRRPGTRTPASMRCRRVARSSRRSPPRWLLDLFDLPRGSAASGFVTGCQMANFTCLAAARHGVLRRAGWDVEARRPAGRAARSRGRRRPRRTSPSTSRCGCSASARARCVRVDGRRAGAHARGRAARGARRAATGRRSSARRPAT